MWKQPTASVVVFSAALGAMLLFGFWAVVGTLALTTVSLVLSAVIITDI